MQEFSTKTYRNVFREIGKSEAEIEERLRQIVHTFFYEDGEKVYFPVGQDMAYIEDTGNIDARTEGMSYGMMICVQLGMKEEFDRIWKWAKTYMYMEDGENEGYFAWSCKPDGTKNAYGPAPDGEEYFAMALFFASHRWGGRRGHFQLCRGSKKAAHCLPAQRGKRTSRPADVEPRKPSDSLYPRLSLHRPVLSSAALLRAFRPLGRGGGQTLLAGSRPREPRVPGDGLPSRNRHEPRVLPL